MNVVFITRCYKPTNIQRIKDNLKSIFEKQDNISYVQYLLVDLTYNEPQQNFKVFEDEHTRVHFTYYKKDHYNNFGIDQLVSTIKGDQNTWIYFLDDDNFITNDFPKIFDNYQGEDVLVVNNNALRFTSLPVIGKVIGNIDISNYVVKLNVMKKNNMYVEGKKSYSADGAFFENLLKHQYKFKCTNIYALTKDALKRPLNVLRKDL